VTDYHRATERRLAIDDPACLAAARIVRIALARKAAPAAVAIAVPAEHTNARKPSAA
jgi:hypothetical protein